MVLTPDGLNYAPFGSSGRSTGQCPAAPEAGLTFSNHGKYKFLFVGVILGETNANIHATSQSAAEGASP
jgi:hypothetical protein